MTDEQTETLLARLRQVGLSRYEASVYLGLVMDETARVADISRHTGVPQPKVYQALDGLVEKGFCAIGPDAVNRYRPVSPRVAIEGHILALRKEQDAARELVDELEVVLLSGRGHARWAPPIEIVKGMRQVRKLLVERISSARDEILYFGKTPHVPGLEIAQAIWDRAQGGCRIRFLFEADYLREGGDPGAAREELGLYRAVPGEKRVCPSLPTKLVLVDRQIATLSISRAGGESFLALALRHAGFVEHVLASFEHHWERARPLEVE